MHDSISLQEIHEVLQHIFECPDYPNELRVYLDSTEANYAIGVKDIAAVRKDTKQLFTRFTYLRLAVLHTNPREIALMMLFERMSNFPGLRARIFFNEESALPWLCKKKKQNSVS